MNSVDKFESYSLPEKETFFESLKLFLKTSGRFGETLIDSVDKYELLSKEEQKKFFEAITKTNLASLLLNSQPEDKSKFKQKTLDYWIISKNSPTKETVKESDKTVTKDRSKSKEKRTTTLDTNDDINRKTTENKVELRNRNHVEVITGKRGRRRITSDESDEKSSEQSDILIASIDLDKISCDKNRAVVQATKHDFESSNEVKTSNFASVKCKSVKNNKKSLVNKVPELIDLEGDNRHEKQAEGKDIFEAKEGKVSVLPQEVKKKHLKKMHSRVVLKDNAPDKSQKSFQSPVNELTDKVENTESFIRHTRNMSKKQTDAITVANALNTNQEKMTSLKSNSSKKLHNTNKTETHTKSSLIKSPPKIKQLETTEYMKSDVENELKKSKFSSDYNNFNSIAKSSNSEKTLSVTLKDSVELLTDDVNFETEVLLADVKANAIKKYKNNVTTIKNSKTVSHGNTAAVSEKSPNINCKGIRKASKRQLKEGKNLSDYEMPKTEFTANKKNAIILENPDNILIHDESKVPLSNTYSNQTKEIETESPVDYVTASNKSSKTNSKVNKRTGKTLSKKSKFHPEYEKSTSLTESDDRVAEDNPFLENHVKLCASGEHSEMPLSVYTEVMTESGNVMSGVKSKETASTVRFAAITNEVPELKPKSNTKPCRTRGIQLSLAFLQKTKSRKKSLKGNEFQTNDDIVKSPDSAVEENSCSVQNIDNIVEYNEVESTSQSLKLKKNSPNLTRKKSSTAGRSYENTIGESISSLNYRVSKSYNESGTCNKAEIILDTVKCATPSSLSKCSVQLHNVCEKNLLPMKQSRNVTKSLQNCGQPLVLPQDPQNKKLKMDETLNHAFKDNETEICLSSSKQLKTLPMSKQSKIDKGLNDQVTRKNSFNQKNIEYEIETALLQKDSFKDIDEGIKINAGKWKKGRLTRSKIKKEMDESSALVDEIKTCRRTKRLFSNETDSSNDTENKISLVTKRVKFSKNTLPNTLTDNVGELSPGQYEYQNKGKKPTFHRIKKNQNSEAVKCISSSTVNESIKTNKTNSEAIVLKENVRNVSKNAALQPENISEQSSIMHDNITDVDTISEIPEHLLNKDINLEKKEISKNKQTLPSPQANAEVHGIMNSSKKMKKDFNSAESIATRDKVQPYLSSPTMLKKFKAYNKLRDACSGLGIDINELFEYKEIKDMTNNTDLNAKDGIVFIGSSKLPTTEKVKPVVYAHSSKKELQQALEKLNFSDFTKEQEP